MLPIHPVNMTSKSIQQNYCNLIDDYDFYYDIRFDIKTYKIALYDVLSTLDNNPVNNALFIKFIKNNHPHLLNNCSIQQINNQGNYLSVIDTHSMILIILCSKPKQSPELTYNLIKHLESLELHKSKQNTNTDKHIQTHQQKEIQSHQMEIQTPQINTMKLELNKCKDIINNIQNSCKINAFFTFTNVKVNVNKLLEDTNLYILTFTPNQDGLSRLIDKTKQYYKFGRSTRIKTTMNEIKNDTRYTQPSLIKVYAYETTHIRQNAESRLRNMINDTCLNITYYKNINIFKATESELLDIKQIMKKYNKAL